MEIPCGQCIGCRLDRSRAWAVRCVHESSLYENNCFVTLTYSDQHLPENNSLDKTHMVKFMKRLRKKYPDQKIRFFQCGEYGEELQRPHHHLLLFNFDFPDKAHFTSRNGTALFLSKDLSELWPFGMHTIGDITFDSACYTARYILKKITGDKAEDHYHGRTPEYITMSRNPGIGKTWYDAFNQDIYSHDHCVVHDNFICRPPKYYDRMYDQQQPQLFKSLKTARKSRAKSSGENTADRLAVKHQIQQIKQKKVGRSYESP